MALRSIPASSPEQTVVLELAKLGALVRGEGVGFQDALLLHGAGAQADSLAGVLLTQAPGRSRLQGEKCKGNCNFIIILQQFLCVTRISFAKIAFKYLAISGSSRRICKVMMKILLQDCILSFHASALYTELGYLRFHDVVIWRLP